MKVSLTDTTPPQKTTKIDLNVIVESATLVDLRKCVDCHFLFLVFLNPLFDCCVSCHCARWWGVEG